MKEIETTIHNAKTHLSKYLAMLERGEVGRIIIKRRNLIVGELKSPPAPPLPRRIFGIMKGRIRFDKAEMDAAAKEVGDLFYASADRLDDQTSS